MVFEMSRRHMQMLIEMRIFMIFLILVLIMVFYLSRREVEMLASRPRSLLVRGPF